MRKKVLWIGDAVKHTGFARITHNVVDRLVAAGGLDVSVLGVNYYGDAAARHYPYDIHPVTLGGDAFGLGILPATIQRVRPDVIVINNDPWIVAEFLIVTRKMGVPLIGYLPVDAPSMKRARDLNGLACAVWYTRFGQAEAEREGYVGPSAIIPHAVDLAQYFPVDRLEARRLLKLPIAPDAFVVGNVNRNSRRKRLDITVRAFAAWWHAAGRPSDAHLFLHCANADDGADLAALARSRLCRLTGSRGTGRVIFSSTQHQPGCGVKEHVMRLIYSALDVQLNTGYGEGWGLPHLEGAACRIAQLVTRYSALGEWLDGAAEFVPARDFMVTGDGINTIGGAPAVDDVAEAIDRLYRDPARRAALGEAAYRVATQSAYDWDNVADQFEQVIGRELAWAARPQAAA